MKKLILGALIILPISSWADWEITAIEPDQAIYHDKKTKHKNKSLVKMWTMTDFPEAREAGFGSFQSFKSLDVFDCSKNDMLLQMLCFFQIN